MWGWKKENKRRTGSGRYQARAGRKGSVLLIVPENRAARPETGYEPNTLVCQGGPNTGQVRLMMKSVRLDVPNFDLRQFLQAELCWSRPTSWIIYLDSRWNYVSHKLVGGRTFSFRDDVNLKSYLSVVEACYQEKTSRKLVFEMHTASMILVWN